MVLNTVWTQIEVVELSNEGSGLGFGISGNKSTGVVVKAIVPGSIADKDGRIRTGDHLFQINHVYVRGMSSEQVAGILRQCSQQVRLVVARSVREPASTTTAANSHNHSPTSSHNSSFNYETPIRMENDGLINNSQKKILLRTERLLESNHNLEKILDHLLEQCQNEDGTELLEVTLDKGDDGLGITVAGYVSPDSTNNDAIAGIFIRDIAEGSVSSRDGRLAIGDQIIEVNEQSLNGFSNVQALYLLQNTSSSVRLKIRRYLDREKYAKIKEMIALESSNQSEEKIDVQTSLSLNEQMKLKWTKILGNNCDILIIDVFKPDNGSLGITLEGTIDVESGEEIGSHHYIRTVLPDGIVGLEGTLKPGDELLEINNQILYGKDHIHVIEILKRMKYEINLICARRQMSTLNEIKSVNGSMRSRSISFGKTTEIAVKAKSMGKLDSMELNSSRLTKCRSLEVISNLALWSKSILTVELNKVDHGLGFSVLDYQDPSNPSYSPVIVIRALVPNGVAQLDGRIVPGDRLVAVNDITLENMTLDDVIKILKSTPKGSVKLSLAKPLPYPKFKNDNEEKLVTDSDQDVQLNSNRRSSRLSKSKTTAEMNFSHQRSKSSHRSTDRKPAVPSGIALSAPAILSRHEYIETLLNIETLRKQIEPRAASAGGRRGRPSKKTTAQKKLTFQTDFFQSMTQQNERNRSSSNVNLPEFIEFQSDHLLLTNQLNCRSPRQSLSPTMSNTIPTNNKRQSRSRHSYGGVSSHEKSTKSMKKLTSKNFDSMSCFKEPDLSSDENQSNLFRSISLTNRYPRQTSVPLKTITDEQTREIRPILQRNDSIMSSTSSLTPTTPVAPSSLLAASPTPSNSSQSSVRQRTSNNEEILPLPSHLEHEIRIKQNFDQLALVVDANVDAGVNGCYVHSVAQTSTCACLKPGDFILAINNENMRKISNAQARAILRRAALIGSDISMIFIPGEEAKKFKADTSDFSSTPSKELDFDAQTPPRKASLTNTNEMDDYPDLIDTESLCATLWGPARTVILYRTEKTKSLGISIVGGKLDFSGPGNTIETCISGIFVKHVIPDSPAGRHSTLKTGDRILEVNAHNLRDATHDHAVEIIRSAESPIYFIVQSLLDPSNPTPSAIPTDVLEIEENPMIKQYGYLDGQILQMDVRRTATEINEPLGLSLIGHRDPTKLAVFVCDVQPNSLIGRDNRIHPGDQLLQVNDEILLGKAHSIVTSIIRSMKSEVLNFVILRNPNGIHEMALNNPYLFCQHSETHSIPRHPTDSNECKDKNDRQTSTSVLPPIKHAFDNRESMTNKKSSNLIRTTNDTENDKTTLPTRDLTNCHSITNDRKSSLSNQLSSELLPKLPSLSTEQKHDDNNLLNGPADSHIPIMSSSSSSSSISMPTQTVVDDSKTKSSANKDNDQTDNDPRTKPIVIGQETLIEIDRGQSGLGVSVVGGSDTQLSAIIIHDIYDGCAAQRDGRLLVGDQILEVNSINLRSATHEEAIQALRQSTHIIRLLVYRGDIANEEDKFDIITVELTKRSGKGLGFSIIGRRHGCGVFISHIIEAGSAEKDGRLMSGDLIVEVNGKDLRTAAYEQVAYILKTLPHGRVEIKIGRLKANARRNQVTNESHTPSNTR